MNLVSKLLETNSTRSIGKCIVAVDVFCGAGGLTRGLLDAGIQVIAGYDIDEACRFPYERNNEPAIFKNVSVVDLQSEDLAALYPPNTCRVLVGCAPCHGKKGYRQTFFVLNSTSYRGLQYKDRG